MQESNAERKRLAKDRERRRIETIRKRHGADFFHLNAKKAGKLTPTKFNSESGSAAANARWAAHRREKGKTDGTKNSQA